MPGYAWPSYAAYPNYAAVTYPKQYSPTAWPYIGPFYPYPQVPLGWRKVCLEWDDGWWFLDSMIATAAALLQITVAVISNAQHALAGQSRTRAFYFGGAAPNLGCNEECSRLLACASGWCRTPPGPFSARLEKPASSSQFDTISTNSFALRDCRAVGETSL
jgi:hypothetical protein